MPSKLKKIRNCSKSYFKQQRKNSNYLTNSKAIDTQIQKAVRKISANELKLQDITFKNLFSYDSKEIKLKLAKRLKQIKEIWPAHPNIKLPSKFVNFIFEVKQWLESGIRGIETLKENEFFKYFKLTEAGDIFKGN